MSEKQESTIKLLWKRREDAEGNPFHKCFERDPLEGEIKILIDGLQGSFDWHRDKQVTARKQAGEHPNDRAILIQSRENIEILRKKFPNIGTLEKDSSFGENFYIEGSLLPSNLCIGDIIEIQRGSKCVAVLQITCPRWPCFKIDYKHSESLKETPFEARVRAYCIENALAGFFCKVIQEGTVQKGDKLVVVKRKHPKWTLEKTSMTFYGGETNRKRCNIVEFQGTPEEFQELLNLEDLADFEWKDRLKEYPEKKKQQKIDEKNKKIIENEKKIRIEKKVIKGFKVLVAIIFLLLLYYIFHNPESIE